MLIDASYHHRAIPSAKIFSFLFSAATLRSWSPLSSQNRQRLLNICFRETHSSAMNSSALPPSEEATPLTPLSPIFNS
ncbi:MAG: hypothetical protein DVB28_000871 [Verrucomicrobia bacterium]|nr:MAG: hypothetical protein DVB28_000871 [Verrucomicrobiota bacterium]